MYRYIERRIYLHWFLNTHQLLYWSTLLLCLRIPLNLPNEEVCFHSIYRHIYKYDILKSIQIRSYIVFCVNNSSIVNQHLCCGRVTICTYPMKRCHSIRRNILYIIQNDKICIYVIRKKRMRWEKSKLDIFSIYTHTIYTHADFSVYISSSILDQNFSYEFEITKACQMKEPNRIYHKC